MAEVLFVCLGNICRSPMAEGVFRERVRQAGLSSEITVDSAATHGFHTGEEPDQRARQVLRQRRIDVSSCRARAVEPADFERFDYILAMDESNLEDLKLVQHAGYGGYLGLLLDFAHDSDVRAVPDPYYGGPHVFYRALDLIEDSAEGLLERVRRDLYR